MRIIGGYNKGMTIRVPRRESVRPTSDQVREALFNILANRIAGCFFADVFAGSGSVGIEALSRGAGACIFIEKYHQCVKIIKDNLNKLDLMHKSAVFQCDAIAGLKRLSEENKKPDIIFVDPPYKNLIVPEVLVTIKNEDLLNNEGVVIVEHFKKNELITDNNWSLISSRSYGNTALSFLQPC